MPQENTKMMHIYIYHLPHMINHFYSQSFATQYFFSQVEHHKRKQSDLLSSGNDDYTKSRGKLSSSFKIALTMHVITGLRHLIIVYMQTIIRCLSPVITVIAGKCCLKVGTILQCLTIAAQSFPEVNIVELLAPFGTD